MTTQQIPTFEHLETIVRYGRQPDHPHYLCHYLAVGEKLAQVFNNEHSIDVYERQFATLLEVISDCLVPYHWRCLCLNQIHRPLHSIQRFSNTKTHLWKINRMQRELSVVSHYMMRQPPARPTPEYTWSPGG